MDKLLKRVGNKVLYDGVKAEFFIPDYFFKADYAEEIGSSYNVFGCFETFHYNNENDPRSKAKKAAFQYPLKFITHPDEIGEETVDIGDGLQKYKVLIYYRNATVFENADLIKSADNVYNYTKLLMNGKLDMMSYEDILRMFELCKYYNGVDLAVPGFYEETMIAEFYRNPKNITELARFIAKTDGTKVKGINEREKVSFTSTFSAITFEDVDTMLTASINAKLEGKVDTPSEMEKVSLNLI